MFEDVCEECFHLHGEHSSDNVWSVNGWLNLEKRSCNFWPLVVVCECQEEVRFSIDTNQGHGILELLGIPPFDAYIDGGRMVSRQAITSASQFRESTMTLYYSAFMDF